MIVRGAREVPESEQKSLTLSEWDIEEARRLLSLIADAGLPPAAQEPASDQISRTRLIERARQEIANRRRRSQLFPRAMFGEPAWDMLLVLYVADGCAPETIRDLRELAGLTHTTALRWLDYLESQQLIARKAHPTDRRSAFCRVDRQGDRAARPIFLRIGPI